MDFLALFLLLVVIAVLASGIYLIVKPRKRRATNEPCCGHCGYNLTGAPSNRCPECGRLFIEAGVIVGSASRSSGRRAVGVVLVIVSLIFLGSGAVSTIFYLQAARQRAVAARQRAIANQKIVNDFLQQQLSNTKQKPSARKKRSSIKPQTATTSAPGYADDDELDSHRNQTP